jgi:hypothetical protein
VIDPPSDISDPRVLADWIELCTLFANPPQTYSDEVSNTLVAAGLTGYTDGGLTEEERLSDELDDLGMIDGVPEAELIAESIFSELQSRATANGDSYPFDVDGSSVKLRGSNWREWPAFTMLLLISTSSIYRAVPYDPNDVMRRLFEKVVEAAATNAFHGVGQRFGWPREPDWPTHPHDRVKRLCELIERDVLSLANVKPSDNDLGLDVVVGMELGHGRDGIPWTLFQCGTGSNWETKKGEPSLTEWGAIVNWQGPISRGIAIPFRLKDGETIARTSVRFDASVVLDLSRLVSAHPDTALDPRIGIEMADWCAGVISALVSS